MTDASTNQTPPTPKHEERSLSDRVRHVLSLLIGSAMPLGNKEIDSNRRQYLTMAKEIVNDIRKLELQVCEQHAAEAEFLKVAIEYAEYMADDSRGFEQGMNERLVATYKTLAKKGG